MLDERLSDTELSELNERLELCSEPGLATAVSRLVVASGQRPPLVAHYLTSADPMMFAPVLSEHAFYRALLNTLRRLEAH